MPPFGTFGDENLDNQAETSQEIQSQKSIVNERRNLLDAKLKGHKQEKLKRKLSVLPSVK